MSPAPKTRKRGPYKNKASSRNPNALLPPDPNSISGTLWRDDYIELARRLCAYLGATVAELAAVIGVSEVRINTWGNEHPEFKAAITVGRAQADGAVAERLYRKALGWEHPAVKILQHEGEPVLVPYTEKFPPDTVACIYWLNNRRSQDWRRRTREAEDGGPAGPETVNNILQVNVDTLNAEERHQLRQLLRRALPSPGRGDPAGTR